MSRLNRVVVAAVLAIGVMLPSTGGVVGANPQPAPRGVCTKVGQVVSAPVRLVCKQTVKNGLRWRKAPITTTTTTTTPIAPSTTAMVPSVSLAATFIDSGTFPKAAVVTANVAGTVYFIEGASPVNTVSDITSARVYRWTSGVVAANTPTSIALDVDVLTNGYYRVFVANSQGVLSETAFNKVTISISRASNVVALSCAAGGTCAVGDTGPGGGVVFYVQATGTFPCGVALTSTCKYLEAAPTDHPTEIAWCSNTTSALGTTATAVGTGMANTTTADGTCTLGAIQTAADYTNNGKTDWYLPSKDELNQMCKWQRGVAWTSDATVCTGDNLNSGRGASGFSAGHYWSSSEFDATTALIQHFKFSVQGNDPKTTTFYVRPVRAFGGTVACADGGVCAVGDTGPGGGKVFYVSATNFTSTGSDCGTTCKYLEAAPTGWGNVIAVQAGETTGSLTVDPQLKWCSDTSTLRNATTKTAIGDGRPNTTTGVTCTTGAIFHAELYAGNGKTDWHLPSKDELNELCKYAKNTGQAVGGAILCANGSAATSRGFSTDYYWSSSESSDGGAWAQDFNVGVQTALTKGSPPWVRPVRAF
jgi:hypothetical protein